MCACVYFLFWDPLFISTLTFFVLAHWLIFHFHLISGEAGEIVFPVTNLLACYFVQTLSKLKKIKNYLQFCPRKWMVCGRLLFFIHNFPLFCEIVINEKATPFNRLTDMCIYFIFMLFNAHVSCCVPFAAVDSHMLELYYNKYTDISRSDFPPSVLCLFCCPFILMTYERIWHVMNGCGMVRHGIVFNVHSHVYAVDSSYVFKWLEIKAFFCSFVCTMRK